MVLITFILYWLRIRNDIIWFQIIFNFRPIFEKLSDDFPAIEFLKVDVDECEDIASGCNISAMPT